MYFTTVRNVSTKSETVHGLRFALRIHPHVERRRLDRLVPEELLRHHDPARALHVRAECAAQVVRRELLAAALFTQPLDDVRKFPPLVFDLEVENLLSW